MQQQLNEATAAGLSWPVYLVIGLVVVVVLLLLLTPPWLLVHSMWKRNRSLNELLASQERRHTQDLLAQSEKFGRQYYSQGERSSLVLSDSLKRVTDSFARAVSGMPED